jgi:hypothetical protein
VTGGLSRRTQLRGLKSVTVLPEPTASEIRSAVSYAQAVCPFDVSGLSFSTRAG